MTYSFMFNTTSTSARNILALTRTLMYHYSGFVVVN